MELPVKPYRYSPWLLRLSPPLSAPDNEPVNNGEPNRCRWAALRRGAYRRCRAIPACPILSTSLSAQDAPPPPPPSPPPSVRDPASQPPPPPPSLPDPVHLVVSQGCPAHTPSEPAQFCQRLGITTPPPPTQQSSRGDGHPGRWVEPRGSDAAIVARR